MAGLDGGRQLWGAGSTFLQFPKVAGPGTKGLLGAPHSAIKRLVPGAATRPVGPQVAHRGQRALFPVLGPHLGLRGCTERCAKRPRVWVAEDKRTPFLSPIVVVRAPRLLEQIWIHRKATQRAGRAAAHPAPPRSVSLPRGTSGAGAGQTPHAAARCRSLPLAEAHGALRLRLPGPAPHLAASGLQQCEGPCFRRRRQFGGVLDWRFGECFPAWVWAGRGRLICPLGSSPSAGLTECASFPAVSPPPHSLFPFGRESPCTVPVSGWGFSFPSRRGEQRRDLPVWEESFARSSPCGPSYFWEQKCRFHTSTSASPLLGRSRVSSAILVVW